MPDCIIKHAKFLITIYLILDSPGSRRQWLTFAFGVDRNPATLLGVLCSIHAVCVKDYDCGSDHWSSKDGKGSS